MSLSESFEEKFFDASPDDIPDDVSNASDISFHSVDKELQNLTLEETFEKSFLSTDVNEVLPNEEEKQTNYFNVTDEPQKENNTDEEKLKSVYEDINTNNELEESSKPVPEEDIYSIDFVKFKDDEIELQLKDKHVETSLEELERITSEAVKIKKDANILFIEESHNEAIMEYNKALEICPLSSTEDRAMIFQNRAVAYVKLGEKKLGVQSLTRAIDLNPKYLKAIVRRAALHEELDNLDEALQDYQKVLEIDPSHVAARQAVVKLPPLIEERNEKLKEEMMGKLKDLGNMFLKPFGLSTNNFEMKQDPNSGGYSFQFNQNK